MANKTKKSDLIMGGAEFTIEGVENYVYKVDALKKLFCSFQVFSLKEPFEYVGIFDMIRNNIEISSYKHGVRLGCKRALSQLTIVRE